MSASKEASVCEEALLLCHVILTKVGPKGEMLDTCKLIPGDLFGYMWTDKSERNTASGITCYLEYIDLESQ